MKGVYIGIWNKWEMIEYIFVDMRLYLSRLYERTTVPTTSKCMLSIYQLCFLSRDSTVAHLDIQEWYIGFYFNVISYHALIFQMKMRSFW